MTKECRSPNDEIDNGEVTSFRSFKKMTKLSLAGLTSKSTRRTYGLREEFVIRASTFFRH